MCLQTAVCEIIRSANELQKTFHIYKSLCVCIEHTSNMAAWFTLGSVTSLQLVYICGSGARGWFD